MPEMKLASWPPLRSGEYLVRVKPNGIYNREYAIGWYSQYKRTWTINIYGQDYELDVIGYYPESILAFILPAQALAALDGGEENTDATD